MEVHRGSVHSWCHSCSFLRPAHRTPAPLSKTSKPQYLGRLLRDPPWGVGVRDLACGPCDTHMAAGWPCSAARQFPLKQRERLAPRCLRCRPRAASSRVLGPLRWSPGQGCLTWLPLERRPGLTLRHFQFWLQQGEGELSRGGREVRFQSNPKAHAPGRPHAALFPAPAPHDTPGRRINSPAVRVPPPPSVSISLALDLTVPVGAASLQNKQQNQYLLRQGRCWVFDDRPGLPPSLPAGPKARGTQPPRPLLPQSSDLITSDEQTFIEHIQHVKPHWA